MMCIAMLLAPRPSIASGQPAADCIDLKAVTGGWRSGERELLLRSGSTDGARLALDPGCPVFEEGIDLETVAAGGVACPGQPVAVRGGGITCQVVRMSMLSAPELADALRARDAHMQARVTLDPVVVRGSRWRSIAGTTDRCVDARFLRGWRQDGNDLVVEVAPMRHAGNRYYRVETVERCPDLASTRSIRLKSRRGGAAVCGRPGDRLVLLQDGFSPMGGAAGGSGRGCEISRVTPLPRG